MIMERLKKFKKNLKRSISTVSAFFISHQSQFLFLLVLLVVLDFLSKMPYLNLLLGRTFNFVLLLFVLIFLFRFSGRFLIKAALVLLCFCLFLLILKNQRWAGEVAILVYGLLLTGLIYEFIVFLKEEKSEKEA